MTSSKGREKKITYVENKYGLWKMEYDSETNTTVVSLACYVYDYTKL